MSDYLLCNYPTNHGDGSFSFCFKEKGHDGKHHPGRHKMNTASIQNELRQWIETRLGLKAMHPKERGRRAGEEVLELMQVLGVDRTEAHRLVDHVYDKPVGDLRQELGGAALTLLGCAEGTGYNLGVCAEDELKRILELPPEKFQKRQSENIRDGIGE